MEEPRRTRPILMILVALVAAIVIAGLVWVALSDGASVPESAGPPGDEAATTGTTAVDATAMAAGEQPDDSEADTGPADAATPTPSERVPAIVESVRTEAGATILTVDYIQFLTGDEAAAAAAERGDESPPPNDYYIVNDNARLREFTVQDGISVVTVVRDDGTSDPGGHTLTLEAWVAQLTGPAGGAFRSSFYWLTVSGDTITTIEQQYLP